MLPHRILDYKTFIALYVLLEDKADALGEQAIALTEQILTSEYAPGEYHPYTTGVTARYAIGVAARYSTGVAARSQFILLVAPGLRVLLIGTPFEGADCQESLPLQVELTFDTQAIATFLKQLTRQLPDPALVMPALRKVTRYFQGNSPQIQSELMLEILARLESSQSALPEEIRGADLPRNLSLHSARQERLFYQIISQMQEGVGLPTILSMAVEEGRNLLQVDRLLIYQFNIFQKEAELESETVRDTPGESLREREQKPKWGYITYEAKISNSVPPVLHLTEEKSCFVQGYSVQEKYQQGWVEAISDVEIKYREFSCLLEMLRRYKIRAKLVAPILVRKQVWGLMIAHQCHYPRRWLEWEKHALKKLADYMAIAIDRSELEKQLLAAHEHSPMPSSSPSSYLQNALLESQMENRIKSEFLAAISHELRTPLTYIIGMSATLLRLAFPSASASSEKNFHLSLTKQREYLQKIQDSGKHLLDLINNLLDLSQLEAGRTVLNIRKFSLTHLIQTCQNSLQKAAEDQGIKLAVEIQFSPQEDGLRADQSRVQQILLNLLNNAIKFTDTGGEVTLTVWREEETVIFQVKDTGIGINRQAFPFLFEKFQQLETAYERQYPGMGLGLALTRQLVELHGGVIEVDSTLGVGSVFTVSLPSQPQNSVSLKSSLNSHPFSGTMPLGRLVLIEDNEQMAWGICDLLTAAGYQAIWLLDGSTVTQQIEVLRPLAIITEIHLPDMTVQELMAILRNSVSTYKIKVIAIAHSSERDTLTPIQPDAYLDKPLKFEQLLQTLNRILRPHS